MNKAHQPISSHKHSDPIEEEYEDMDTQDNTKDDIDINEDLDNDNSSVIHFPAKASKKLHPVYLAAPSGKYLHLLLFTRY